MRFLGYLAGGMMLAASGMALADEPMQLDAAAMDGVTAGFWSGGSIAFTSNGFASGNAISFFELSQTSATSKTEIRDGKTKTTFVTSGSAQQQIRASGTGATSAGGSGGTFSTVFSN